MTSDCSLLLFWWWWQRYAFVCLFVCVCLCVCACLRAYVCASVSFHSLGFVDMGLSIACVVVNIDSFQGLEFSF